MASLAGVESAPVGTQRKIAGTDNWVDASVGDVLMEDDLIQNTQGNSYQVALYSRGMIQFRESVSVMLSNLNGTVKYQNTAGDWVQIQEDGSYTLQAVGVGAVGGGSVVCGKKGLIKPVPWP
ncbi:MAG: hypothetical protein NTW14_07500 [bacterium]|nr:hypothetical protein [bacterium]